MDSIEKASFLMGKSYTKTQEGATHSSNVTMITGTATSDSADGVVSVDLGGNTISANDEQSVEISTTCAVKAGDVVQVSVIGADGTAKSLLVTGVIAGGDRMQADVETAKDVAQSANQTANTTKIYFYSDESGAHVRNQDSTSAGTRADIKTDGLHVIDQDDGKELASFTSNGTVIGKTNTTHSRTTSTGIQFNDGKKSWAYASIDALTSDPELYDDGNTFSGAYYDSSPDDVATNDGYYHSLSRMYTGAKKGTSSDTPSYAFTGISAVTENANTGITKTASISVHTANAANTRSNYPETSFASIDADAMYINGFKLPKIVQGSKVVNPNGTSAVLFSKSELATILGVSSIDIGKLTIAVSNGDAAANSTHIESAAFYFNANNIYVTFASNTSKAYRVNYLIAYNG